MFILFHITLGTTEIERTSQLVRSSAYLARKVLGSQGVFELGPLDNHLLGRGRGLE